MSNIVNPTPASTGANPTASVGLTAVNGSAATFMRSDAAPTLDQTAAFAFTGLGATTINFSIAGNTDTDGLVLVNPTAATVGQQRYSPAIRLTGQGWATGAAASTTQDIRIVNEPIQGATADSTLIIYKQKNGGGYSVVGDYNSTHAASWTFINSVYLQTGGVLGFGTTRGNISSPANGTFLFENNAGTSNFNLTTAAAATLQLGAANAASPVAQTFKVQGSRSGTDSNVAGATLTIQPGDSTGNVVPPNVIIKGLTAVASGSGAQTVIPCVEFGAKGSGEGVIFVANATTLPSTNPTGGGILYCDSGALKYRGSGGTVTTLGAA